MENYDRYQTETAESYEKRGIMDYLVRIPSDKKLIPMISQIKGKRILDVGLGTGLYTRLLMKDNEVIGVDRNPHLCGLAIKVHEGDATHLAELVGAERFDIVFSTWMTEYLDGQQFSSFLSQAKMVLKENGRLMSTVISKCGFGFMYITAAKLLRGINKYNYTKKQIAEKLKEAGFAKIEIVDINSWLGIPWAYMMVAQ